MRAVAPLIAALKEQSGPVRAASAEALGGLKDQRAVAPLIAVLKRRDPVVAPAAARALKALTGQDFGTDGAWQRQPQRCRRSSRAAAASGPYTKAFARDK